MIFLSRLQPHRLILLATIVETAIKLPKLSPYPYEKNIEHQFSLRELWWNSLYWLEDSKSWTDSTNIYRKPFKVSSSLSRLIPQTFSTSKQPKTFKSRSGADQSQKDQNSLGAKGKKLLRRYKLSRLFLLMVRSCECTDWWNWRGNKGKRDARILNRDFW